MQWVARLLGFASKKPRRPLSDADLHRYMTLAVSEYIAQKYSPEHRAQESRALLAIFLDLLPDNLSVRDLGRAYKDAIAHIDQLEKFHEADS